MWTDHEHPVEKEAHIWLGCAIILLPILIVAAGVWIAWQLFG